VPLWRPRASETFVRQFEDRLDKAEQDYDDGVYWVSYKITGNDELELLSWARHGKPRRWGRRL
jgi:hypothetical protein